MKNLSVKKLNQNNCISNLMPTFFIVKIKCCERGRECKSEERQGERER